jgi:putative ABC transport system permease protein
MADVALGVQSMRGVASVTVAGPGLLAALGIPQTAPALAAGQAVVINGAPLQNGRLGLSIYDHDGNQSSRSIPAITAQVGSYEALGAALISPATATALGLSPTTQDRLWTLRAKPTGHQVDAANAILLGASTSQTSLGAIQVASGLDDSRLLLVPLALLAISTLVTFGVTAIATALSAAESKGDFATLSAVGATPFVRRKLAMGQAGVLALLGGVLGIAAGLVPVSAVIAVRSNVLTLTVPWQVIALALLVVPLVAALGAGLFTRSRLPLARRLT